MKQARSAIDLTQPHDFDIHDGETSISDVIVTEHYSETELLGPDGSPYQYERPRVGFVLKGKRN